MYNSENIDHLHRFCLKMISIRKSKFWMFLFSNSFDKKIEQIHFQSPVRNIAAITRHVFMDAIKALDKSGISTLHRLS